MTTGVSRRLYKGINFIRMRGWMSVELGLARYLWGFCKNETSRETNLARPRLLARLESRMVSREKSRKIFARQSLAWSRGKSLANFLRDHATWANNVLDWAQIYCSLQEQAVQTSNLSLAPYDRCMLMISADAADTNTTQIEFNTAKKSTCYILLASFISCLLSKQ